MSTASGRLLERLSSDFCRPASLRLPPPSVASAGLVPAKGPRGTGRLAVTMTATTEAEAKEAKLWGGRFQESVTPAVEKFGQSVSYDQKLYKFDIQGSKAHATMLAKQVRSELFARQGAGKPLQAFWRLPLTLGISFPVDFFSHIESLDLGTPGSSKPLCEAYCSAPVIKSTQGLMTESDRDAIVKGLTEIERQIDSGEFKWREDREDVHMNIEAALTDIVGEPAKKLHTARSRNDQVCTDVRLWCRNAIDETLRGIKRLQVGDQNKRLKSIQGKRCKGINFSCYGTCSEINEEKARIAALFASKRGQLCSEGTISFVLVILT